jgi:hypothetical protein
MNASPLGTVIADDEHVELPDDLKVLREYREAEQRALAEARRATNGAHVRELLGAIGNFEYARGSHIILRRLIGEDMWHAFCGIDAWPHEQPRLVANVAESTLIELDGGPPDSTSIATLAAIIQNDPMRAALRWLNLEAQVRVQRAHLEILTGKVSRLHGAIR